MAESNTLSNEEVRVGWFLHEDSKSGDQPLAAVLRRTNDRVTLTIPISPTGQDRATERWFSGRSVVYNDDPTFSKFRYDPPRSIIFADAKGAVGLFKCRSLGYRSILGGAAEGRLRVGFAIFGARDLNYNEPTHVRSFIPGMGKWTGLSAITVTRKHTVEGSLKEVAIKASSVDAIELTQGATLKTNWSYTKRESDNYLELDDPPFVETEFISGATLADHLSIHQVFQELVDLAHWAPTGYRRIQCHLVGDNVLNTARNWRDVETDYVRRQMQEHSDGHSPLFLFNEVGPKGFNKWKALREDAGKAIAPLMTLLDIRESAVEMQFIQSCVGLEGIGVYLLRGDGRYNRRIPLVERLERITESLGFSFSDDWHIRTSSLYNDMKHYDRDAISDPIEIWNNLLENQLIFRSWAALQIGLDKNIVEDRIQYTSAAQQLVGKRNFRFKDYPKTFRE